MDQVVAVLVRPDPTPEVGVEDALIDADSRGVITVKGTQKGVFYQLRLDADDTPVGDPGLVKAYRTTRPGTCAYLETTLTVNVRPNPAVKVSVETLIYDYHTKARFRGRHRSPCSKP